MAPGECLLDRRLSLAQPVACFPHPKVKRSSKRMASCALAMPHSRGGIFHSFGARFNTRKRSFRALAGAHAARVHRNDLLVETGEPTLVLADQLRIEGRQPIPGDPEGDLAGLGQYALPAVAVTAIGPAIRRAGLQVMGDLRSTPARPGPSSAPASRPCRTPSSHPLRPEAGRGADREQQAVCVVPCDVSFVRIVMASIKRFCLATLKTAELQTQIGQTSESGHWRLLGSWQEHSRDGLRTRGRFGLPRDEGASVIPRPPRLGWCDPSGFPPCSGV
jgi:hypothetical protein